MSGQEPFDPYTPPDDGPPPVSRPPLRWGLLETVIGIGLTAGALLMLGMVFVTAALSLGWNQESLAFRYGAEVVTSLTFIGVPILLALAVGAGLSALGLRRLPPRALWEAPLTAAGLYLLAEGYETLMTHVSPAIAKLLEEESKKQMDALAAPWPLLVGIAVVLAPIAEEFWFRGFLFGTMRGRLGFAWASGLAAAVFALAHVPMWWSMVPLFCVALGCASMFERHRSLWAAVLTHASFNAIQLAIYYAVPVK